MSFNKSRMDEKPSLVTVLITFYNQKSYVDEALNSVIGQETSFNYQIIIGDDGSNDETVEKIEDWKRNFPNLIRIMYGEEAGKNTVRGGRASRNRLRLLELVDTPYFIFLDGDDYWSDKYKLQKQYEEINARPRVVGVAHRICVFDENNPSKIQYLPQKGLAEREYTLKDYWPSLYFHTNTILFRSKYIKRIKRKILIDSFNDNLITYSFLQFGNIFYSDESMCVYRQNNNGIWVGENMSVSTIRNIMSYDLEVRINPTMRKAAQIRHIGDFIYFNSNADIFKNVDEKYLSIAKVAGCKTAVRALTKGRLFYSNPSMEERAIRRIYKHYEKANKIN